MDYLKAFITKLQNFDHSRRTDTIFKDFLTLSTYAIMQPFYRSPEIEQKYNNFDISQPPKFLRMTVSSSIIPSSTQHIFILLSPISTTHAL